MVNIGVDNKHTVRRSNAEQNQRVAAQDNLQWCQILTLPTGPPASPAVNTSLSSLNKSVLACENLSACSAPETRSCEGTVTRWDCGDSGGEQGWGCFCLRPWVLPFPTIRLRKGCWGGGQEHIMGAPDLGSVVFLEFVVLFVCLLSIDGNFVAAAVEFDPRRRSRLCASWHYFGISWHKQHATKPPR